MRRFTVSNNGTRRNFFLHIPTGRILSPTQVLDEGFAREENGSTFLYDDFFSFLPLGFYNQTPRGWASAPKFQYYQRPFSVFVPVDGDGNLSKGRTFISSGPDLISCSTIPHPIMQHIGSAWDMDGARTEPISHIDMSSEALPEVVTNVRIKGDASGAPWMRMIQSLPRVGTPDMQGRFGVVKDTTTGVFLILDWANVPREKRLENPILKAEDGPLPWMPDVLKKGLGKKGIVLWNQRTGFLGLINNKGESVGAVPRATSLCFYEPSLLEKTISSIGK